MVSLSLTAYEQQRPSVSASCLENPRKYGGKGSRENTFDLAGLDLKNYARTSPESCLSDLKTNTGGDLLAVPSSQYFTVSNVFPHLLCCNSGLLLRTQVLRKGEENCITAFFSASWHVIVLEVTPLSPYLH